MPPNSSLKVQGVKVSLPQPTSQRRVVLEALEEKDEERALQVQDLDGNGCDPTQLQLWTSSGTPVDT